METAEAVHDKVAWARERLADSSAGLTFEPGEHRYFLGGREMRSVSSIVEHFAPFDSIAMAKKCAANPKHPLYGKTEEEILAAWAEKRDAAAAAGTRVHAFGEACYLYLCGQEDQIDAQFLDRVTSEGLAAVEPKEIACARWWAERDWSRYTVVAKETRIVNPELGYAGTLDLLLYDRLNDAFPINDYKSNEDLYKWYGDMLLPPLNMIRSNDVGKYTLQQTAYTIQMRNAGLRVPTNELIWLREDGEYETVPLDMRYDKVVAFAIRQMNDKRKT